MVFTTRTVALCLLFCLGCSGGGLSAKSQTDDGNSSQANPPATEAPPGATPPPSTGTPLPAGNLELENVGTKERVAGIFDRWKLKTAVTAGRGTTYAEVTSECQGRVDLDYALTAEQWMDSTRRTAYYTAVDRLIGEIGEKMIADNGNKLTAAEKPLFLRALKALAWQESRWQHYVRYKDWFFVILSGGSYNALDDWGISQVARSMFNAKDLLNTEFFNGRGHCSIAGSLAYGYLEYYRNYMEARSLACNNTGDPVTKLVGAYNRYSSGFSACYNGFSSDAAYKQYQVNAMGGFKTNYTNTPWASLTGR